MRCQLLRCRFSSHPLSEVGEEERVEGRGRKEREEWRGREKELFGGGVAMSVEESRKKKGCGGGGSGEGSGGGSGGGTEGGSGGGGGAGEGNNIEGYNACFGGALEFPAGPPQSATGPVGTKDKVF